MSDFTMEQLAVDPILQYFHYAHLPEPLQSVSAAYCTLALFIVEALPRNAERTVSLRKLLEAKDAGVRANVGATLKIRADEPEKTFYDRLLDERDQLEDRQMKLGAFIGTPTHDALPAAQRELLGSQLEAMSDYLGILDERISLILIDREKTTARQSDKPDEVIEDGIKFVGGDLSETPVPFKD